MGWGGTVGKNAGVFFMHFCVGFPTAACRRKHRAMIPFGQSFIRNSWTVKSSNITVQQEMCNCYLHALVVCFVYHDCFRQAYIDAWLHHLHYDYMAMCMLSWALCVLAVVSDNT